MMLHKAAQWFINADLERLETGKEYDFEICAIKVGAGYVVTVSMNGSTPIFISSQRTERRVFKTLDGLAKALRDNGIHKFRVY